MLKFVILLIIFLLGSADVYAVCSSPAGKAGAREWFASEKKLKYCNDTTWVTMQSGGIDLAATISGTAFANFSGATNVSVSGTYAYVVGSQRFSIVDITDRQSPVILKTIEDSNLGSNTASYGNYVYISGNGTNRIYTIDVTDKNNPVNLGFVSHANLAGISAMEVSGNYLYVGATSRLTIVDLTTPSAPAYSGSVLDATRLNGNKDLAFTGNHVIVSAVSYNGITAVDVTSKTTPSVTGYINGISGASSVVVNGDYAYVTRPASNRIVVVNISNKATPSISLSITDNAKLAGVRDLAIKDNRLYAAGIGTYPSSSLVTYDVTSAATPVYYGDNSQGDGYNPFSLYIRDDTMVALSNAGGSMMFVFDLTAKPVLESEQAYYYRGPPTNLVDLSVSGTLAVALDSNEKLYVFDVTTPSSFVALGEISMPNGNFTRGSAALAFDGYYAYVTESSNRRIFVVDVGSNPSQPTIVGTVAENSNLIGITGVDIVGDYLFVVGSSGMSIVNVTTKTNPSITSFYSALFGKYIKVKGNYAYVSTSFMNSIDVYSVVDKVNPALVGSYNDFTYSSNAGAIDILGNYLYFPATNRFTVLNISTPNTPTLASSLYNTMHFSSVVQVKIVSSTAYLLGQKLVTISLTNPASPTYTNNVTTDSTIGFAALGATTAGVFTGTTTGFRSYSTASAPVLLKTSSSQIGNVGGVSASGNYAFVTTLNALISFDISSPASPVAVSTLNDDIKLLNVRRHAASGTRLFAVGSGYITALDVSTPTSPTLSGYLSDGANLPSAKTIKIVGNYAYVGGDKVTTLDITGTNPVRIHTLSHARINGCNDMAQVGNYLYLTCENTGSFVVVSIANPVAPAVVGSFQDYSYIAQLEDSMIVSNNMAYIAIKNDYPTMRIDVSNPAAPVMLDELGWWCSVLLPSSNQDRYFCEEDDKIFTMDVSNRYAEESVKDIPVSAGGTFEEGVISGNLLISFVQGGLHISSVADSATASRKARLGGDKPLNEARGIDIVGNIAYVITKNNYLNIFDVSDITSATLMSSTFLSDYSHAYVDPYEIVVSGNYAYIAGNEDNGIGVYNISNLAKPVRVANFWSGVSMVDVTYLKVVGTKLFATGNRLQAMDISNPAAPIWGDYSAAGLSGPKGFDVSGNYAFVCATNRLTPVNISNYASLSISNSLLDSTRFAGCKNVVVSGTLAFVTASTNGYLSVVNIATPTSMTLLGSIQSTASFGSGSSYYDIALSGTTVVVANSNLLTTIDVSTPASPTIIDTFPVTGNQGFTKIVGHQIFAAQETNDIIGVYNLGVPLQMGSCSKAGQLEYDFTYNAFKVCNGAIFNALTLPGSGGTACNTPYGAIGAMDYHSPTNKLRYCDGANWIQIGP